MVQVNALIAVPPVAHAISITLSARLAILVISCSTQIAWPFLRVHLLTMSTLLIIFAWLATTLARVACITLHIAPLAAGDHCMLILA